MAPKFQTVSRVQIKVLKFKALEVFKHLGYTNCGGKSLRWGIVALLMGHGQPGGGGSEAKLILYHVQGKCTNKSFLLLTTFFTSIWGMSENIWYPLGYTEALYISSSVTFNCDHCLHAACRVKRLCALGECCLRDVKRRMHHNLYYHRRQHVLRSQTFHIHTEPFHIVTDSNPNNLHICECYRA